MGAEAAARAPQNWQVRRSVLVLAVTQDDTHTMKRLWLALAAVFLAGSLQAAEPTWLTDLDKAKARAAAEKKHVLINFTGSDWCTFCIKLQKEVFSTPEFAEYAQKHLVLVEIDFPRKKEQQPELKKANKKHQEQYGVTGYPTLILLDSSGKQVGKKVGYGGGGLAAVLADLGLKK